MSKPRVVPPTCNPSTLEAEAREWRVLGQPGLCMKILSAKPNQTKRTIRQFRTLRMAAPFWGSSFCVWYAVDWGFSPLWIKSMFFPTGLEWLVYLVPTERDAKLSLCNPTGRRELELLVNTLGNITTLCWATEGFWDLREGCGGIGHPTLTPQRQNWQCSFYMIQWTSSCVVTQPDGEVG